MDSQTKSSKVADTVAEIKGIPTRADLKNLLEQNVLTVDFTKLNGDKRVMTCTMREDIKPAVKESTAKKKPNDAVVNVWDVNAKGWRSFRYDRINAIEYVTEYEQNWYTVIDSST